jgi:hypothetical protein
MLYAQFKQKISNKYLTIFNLNVQNQTKSSKLSFEKKYRLSGVGQNTECQAFHPRKNCISTK